MQLNISERTGRGVPKVTEVYGKDSYEFREQSIVCTIPFNRISTDSVMYLDNKNTQDDTQYNTQDDITKLILQYCTEPHSMDDLLKLLGFKEKKSVRRRLLPLIEAGKIAMTIPDKPTSKNQKYITIAK